MYKNNCSILGLIKGRCKFTTSDFPAENPARRPATVFILNVRVHLKKQSMTIEHSKQLNEFLSFYIETKVNGELKYETILDYFQSNFRLVELNTEIEYSFEFQSKVEKEIEDQIRFEIEKIIKSKK